jgi:hypothetical protein
MTYPPVPPGQGSYPYPPDGYRPAGGYPPPPPVGYPLPPPANYPPPPAYPPQPGYLPPPLPGYPALPASAYTPWITRVAAALIDGAIYSVIVAAGIFPFTFTGTRTCERESTATTVAAGCQITPSTLGMVLFVVAMLAAMAFLVWNYGYRQGTTGSSVGKSVMKFKVVGAATGAPIGFGRSLLRQLAHTLDGLACNIGYLFPLWDAKRQTFADKIMSTVCVPTEGETP